MAIKENLSEIVGFIYKIDVDLFKTPHLFSAMRWESTIKRFDFFSHLFTGRKYQTSQHDAHTRISSQVLWVFVQNVKLVDRSFARCYQSGNTNTRFESGFTSKLNWVELEGLVCYKDKINFAFFFIYYLLMCYTMTIAQFLFNQRKI